MRGGGRVDVGEFCGGMVIWRRMGMAIEDLHV